MERLLGLIKLNLDESLRYLQRSYAEKIDQSIVNEVYKIPFVTVQTTGKI